MKKILVGLLMIGVLNAHANRFYDQEVNCKVTGSYSTKSERGEKALPNQLTFKSKLDRELGDRKITIAKTEGSELMKGIVKIKSTNYIEFTQTSRQSVNIKFEKLSPEKTKELLIALGAENVPDFSVGVSFGKINICKGFCVDGSGTAFEMGRQEYIERGIYFPANVHDGLGYTIGMYCILNDSAH